MKYFLSILIDISLITSYDINENGRIVSGPYPLNRKQHRCCCPRMLIVIKFTYVPL